MKPESIFWLFVSVLSAALAVVYIGGAVERIRQHLREIKALRRRLKDRRRG
jgi:hypothetical protein